MNRQSLAGEHAASMHLAADDAGPVVREEDLLQSMLPLPGARIVDLGAGSAANARWIARQFPATTITAYEVDVIQHAANMASAGVPNLRFAAGGAHSIPEDDESVDVVLMFKSLHHVPLDSLDQAFGEIRRVLRNRGLAYISEPVFAGELNEIVRIFHDEESVRLAAFAAVRRAVDSGHFELVDERFFRLQRAFADFADFEQKVIGATYNDNRLTHEQMESVRSLFARHLGVDGARFTVPMRVDLLRKVR